VVSYFEGRTKLQVLNTTFRNIFEPKRDEIGLRDVGFMAITRMGHLVSIG
jgi:hypothetical protein